MQLDKNTGEIINTYNSTQDVQNKLGIRHGDVKSAIERGGSWANALCAKALGPSGEACWTSGGFLWKEKVRKFRDFPMNRVAEHQMARLTAIKETVEKNGIIDKEHIITYSQVRRYIS